MHTLVPQHPYAPHPPRTYGAGPTSYDSLMTPTKLGATFSTITLPHPNDAWYIDSGAACHMTHSSGNLLPLFNLSTKNHILVVNDNHISITGYGHTTLPNQPLTLRDVHLAPQIIKNIISVRKSAFDYSVSIEFDPYDFL